MVAGVPRLVLGAGILAAACSGHYEEGRAQTSSNRTPSPVVKPLFAFKTGLGYSEQIYLWLEDGRRHRVSTWATGPQFPVPGPSSSAGYLEGLGRFGRLRFDHQRRFLVTGERMVNPAAPSDVLLRLVSYELATGRVIFAPPVPGAPRSEDGLEVVVTPAATLIVHAKGHQVSGPPGSPPVAHRAADGKPWLFDFREGTLVPAAGAELIGAPFGFGFPLSAAALSGEPVLSFGPVVRRQAGIWRAVDGMRGGQSLHINGAPSDDTLCIVGDDATAKRRAWLLSADGTLAQLPCEGAPIACAFSPGGDRVYLSGCKEPLVSRDGRAQPGPRLRLFDQARVPSAGGYQTLATLDRNDVLAGARSTILAFDWSTQVTRPLLPLERQMLPCPVVAVETPPGGTGMAEASVQCGFGGYDSYAIDLAAERMHLIVRTGGSFIYGRALIGSAIVTTLTGSPTAAFGPDASTIFWSDTNGSREVGPLPGLEGSLHNPVAY